MDEKTRRYAEALESHAVNYKGFELGEALKAGAQALRSQADRPVSSGTIDEEDVWKP